jgi:ABC-type nitrate/sulfonate/bicarbonate transport system ATPase subunit/ABC-type transporter Mla maintaining outer membrane lipid asymmetry permease subunit MlaE
MTEPLLSVRGLSVTLPDGRALIRSLDLDVGPGEVVVILGGSGAGKTTLIRALFDRGALQGEGYKVTVDEAVARVGLGLVPQRGALFDHLDVAGNLRVALRNAEPPREADSDAVRTWLTRFDLAPELARPGTSVTGLSGGQAQRLAVARTLAGGRPLVFLDEPSAGLDPYRVRLLAREIRRHGAAEAAASVVVTHDVALAAGVGDRLLLLDPSVGKLVPLLDGQWPGPQAEAATEEAARWQNAVEAALVEHLIQGESAALPAGRARGGRIRRWLARVFEPFRVAAVAIVETLKSLPRRPLDFFLVLRHVLRQSFARPLPFYVIVSVLLGFTVLYVVTRVAPGGVRPGRAIELVGASYITALTPPLTAFLFVATSGSAINAWLGGMALTRQILALEALGIPRTRYLWAPAWVGLGISFLAGAAVFAAGLLAGGLLLCAVDGVPNGWEILGSDLFDPAPDRAPYTVRAGWLIWIYAWGIASDAVARGSAHKDTSESVTAAMTKSVVASTLWVVFLELTSVFILFAVQRVGP